MPKRTAISRGRPGKKRAITLRRTLPDTKIRKPHSALSPKEASMPFDKPQGAAMPDPENTGADSAAADKRVIPPVRAARTTGTLHLPSLTALRPTP
jgi:hypothetical protein